MGFDKKKIICVIAGGTVGIGLLGGGFLAGNLAATKGVIMTSVSPKVKNAMDLAGNTDKYDKLFKVREDLLSRFDGKINDDDLVNGAIKGMTEALNDPYTVYMTEEEYKEFNKQSSDEYVGIGIYIGIKDKKVTIISPVAGSPAEKAGIKSGDVILEVDKKAIGGDSDKAANLISGKEGTDVNIKLEREGHKEPISLNIKRKKIKRESVKGEIFDGGIGYVQLTGFNQNVTKDLKSELKSLKEKGMKGLILDLRGNPGGYLDEAIGVASQFIPRGDLITYTIDKHEKKNEDVSRGGEFVGIPLVVLVDEGSASASEVVTGALRDYNVATIVGTKTFGKGIVQAPIEYKDGSAVKVTISKYYTPKGENIHKKGISPDIEVKIPKELLDKPYNKNTDPQLKKAKEVLNEKMK